MPGSQLMISLALALVFAGPSTLAQSPNTATIVVTVEDQNGAMVNEANVSAINDATGAKREAVTGTDGTATFAALSLTGSYAVAVSKQGFSTEERKEIKVRSGETATLRVKLSVGTTSAEVTVYGTTEGVRANSQIGIPLESTRIDETPILGRKVTTLPLLNSAFRQGKGTGDLFVNQTYFITGVSSRRATTYTANMLGRGVTVYGNGATANSNFGWFVPANSIGADGHAIPAFANIDPPRMCSNSR